MHVSWCTILLYYSKLKFLESITLEKKLLTKLVVSHFNTHMLCSFRWFIKWTYNSHLYHYNNAANWRSRQQQLTTFLKEMQKCVGKLEYISVYMCQQDHKLLIHCSQMQELQDELQQQKERAGKLVKDS